MVAVMNPLTKEEWMKATGTMLADDESGIVIALPKLSFCKPQEPIYVRRDHYRFEMEYGRARHSPKESDAHHEEVLFAFLTTEYINGRKYSKSQLDAEHNKLGMSRQRARDAATRICTQGRMMYHEVGPGLSGSHYAPVADTSAGASGEGWSESADL
jgi:hypothetical protein